MNALRILFVAVMLASATAQVAAAADAPLRGAERPTSSSRIAQLGYDLPPGWSVLRGELEGTPSRGSYQRAFVQDGGARCTLSLYAAVRAVKAAERPFLRRGVLRQGRERLFRVARRGRGEGAWYRAVPTSAGQTQLGEVSPEGVAPVSQGVVVLPARPVLELPGRPLVVAQFSLTALLLIEASEGAARPAPKPTAEQRRRCIALARARSGQLLTQVLTSSRVEAYTAEPDVS